MTRTASTIAGLGTPRYDGDTGVIRTESGREIGLTWNADQEAWVSSPDYSMRQFDTFGMSSNGSPSSWKYPHFIESPEPEPLAYGFGFQIHKILNPTELWEAGLRLQEHLSASLRISDTPVGDDPIMALNWYELAVGDDFLSPLPENQGVNLVGDENLHVYKWWSSGWQNSPVPEPFTGANWYPELYTLHSAVTFRNFTALHRWVGGTVGAGGSAETPSQYPPAIENLVSWNVAEHIPVADGGLVADWPDFSGRGRSLLQPTTGKQPTVRRDGAGQIRHVRFDNKCLRTALLTVEQPLTVFLVMRQRSGGATQQVWLGNNGFGPTLIYRSDASGGTNVWSAGTDLTYTHAGGWPTDWMIWSAVMDGADTTVWENLTEVAAGDPGAVGFGGLVMGNRDSEALPARIDVAELIMAVGALDDTDRTTVVNYLNAKYEIF